MKRLRPYRPHRRHSFGAAAAHPACATSERWVRGGLGFLLGTMIGSTVGAGIATVTATQEIVHEEKLKTWPMWLASGLTIVGGVGGALLGARKPAC